MIDNEQVQEIFLVLEDKLEKTVSVLREEFAAVRAGRANPHILDKIQAEAYGGMSPLNQLGNISALDARCLVVSPWDKSLLKSIEKAILSANIGLTPTNDGNVIRLTFPQPTEERRRELTRQVAKTAEDSKVAIRAIRRDAMEKYKDMKKSSEITEDDLKGYEKDIQDLTDKYCKEIDKMAGAKEKEIMEI